MKFRPQRGGYSESMAEVVEVSSKSELKDIVLDFVLPAALFGVDPSFRHKSDENYVLDLRRTPEYNIEVTPLGVVDPRNGWDSHIVLLNGQAVGFTDGPAND